MKVGDTVRLKSGGPRMTVDSIDQSGGKLMVACTWFDDKNNPRHASFKQEMLEPDDGSMPDLDPR